MLLQAAQDQDGGPVHPVDQGGPAKPGLLLQSQTLDPEAGAHFLALAGEVAEEPFRLLRARPQALAVAEPIPITVEILPAPDLFPVHPALEGQALPEGFPDSPGKPPP